MCECACVLKACVTGVCFSCGLVDTGCLVLRWHAMLQICIARVFVVCRKTCVRRPCVWCVFFTDLECVCALCLYRKDLAVQICIVCVCAVRRIRVLCGSNMFHLECLRATPPEPGPVNDVSLTL